MKKRQILWIYITFGISWIIITDFLVGKYIPLEMAMTVQKTKGIFFIVLTGICIYYILKKIEELNCCKEQEDKLSTLINSMVDFVAFKDGQGRWVKANDSCLKLFQLENVDYQGKKDCELAKYTDFYHKALMHCEKLDEEAWLNRDISRSEQTLPIPDGTKKYFETIKVPLFNEDGSRKGLVVIGRDITDRKLAEEQLRKKEKLSIVGELAASVGHEIKNPLTSIKGFVQILGKKDKEDKMYYDIMTKELERIDHIVGELLLLAKPQKIVFSTYDVKEIVADIVSLLQTQANMNNVTIHFQTQEPLLIDCEKNLLKQLFINIIKNAIEACKENGNVTVNIEKGNEKNVIVTVEDDGCGIPKEFQKRLGEPFYSSKEKGTGLGLTVSHKIVQQHGGKINVKSEEDVGTQVKIHLPFKNSKSPS